VGKKEQQLNRLQGKVAVITSGSSGMGFATAEQFVSEGAYPLIPFFGNSILLIELVMPHATF
jgi:hypothetical protein